MQIVSIDIKNPDLNIIKHASEVLSSGGCVVYPTDTAYGLGVNALKEEAIKKLYEIKGRDFSKPTHVVVKDWQMIEELTYTNEKAKRLFDTFLPGPLTMILPKKPHVSNVLTANGPTLGVRLPNSLITQSLSDLITFPYTTPSANRSGEPTPYSVEEVKKVLDIEKVDLILDAGPLPRIAPSTVIDLTQDEFQILREGPITREEIEKALE
jgi:L-threonylcarbamoyladenylate synthase